MKFSSLELKLSGFTVKPPPMKGLKGGGGKQTNKKQTTNFRIIKKEEKNPVRTFYF